MGKKRPILALRNYAMAPMGQIIYIFKKFELLIYAVCRHVKTYGRYTISKSIEVTEFYKEVMQDTFSKVTHKIQ